MVDLLLFDSFDSLWCLFWWEMEPNSIQMLNLYEFEQMVWKELKWTWTDQKVPLFAHVAWFCCAFLSLMHSGCAVALLWLAPVCSLAMLLDTDSVTVVYFKKLPLHKTTKVLSGRYRICHRGRWGPTPKVATFLNSSWDYENIWMLLWGGGGGTNSSYLKNSLMLLIVPTSHYLATLFCFL